MENENLVRLRYSSEHFTSSLRAKQFVDSVSEPMTMREAKVLMAAGGCTLIEEAEAPVVEEVKVLTVPAPVSEVTEPVIVKAPVYIKQKHGQGYEHKGNRNTGEKTS
jgi:hypothetical protein